MCIVDKPVPADPLDFKHGYQDVMDDNCPAVCDNQGCLKDSWYCIPTAHPARDRIDPCQMTRCPKFVCTAEKENNSMWARDASWLGILLD